MASTQPTIPVHFTVDHQVTTEQESSARTGRLTVPGRNVVETPTYIPLSSRGVIPHLTPDMVLRHAGFSGVYLALEDFVEKATNSTPPIMSCPPGKSTPLHAFTALPSSLLTVLGPRRIPAVAAPTGNMHKSISIFTSVGFRSLSNSDWIKYAQSLKPDIVVGLADVSYGSVPGTKRVEKMADRTSSWLDELLPGLRTVDGDRSTPPSAIFAPVLPIDIHSQSEYLDHLADDLAHEIHGLAFYSSSVLPDIPATTSLSQLPRLSLDEPPSPHHILRQVSLGMDLLTVPFINIATDAGLALMFKFSGLPTITDSVPGQMLDLAIDLSHSSHAMSIAPLLSTCRCYTCTSHSRAYIHHLLSAQEMLGWVLLQIHNHFIVSSFFSALRESIHAGSFEEGKYTFERIYESSLPAGGGQRPKARGYHFKSEGPGEKRKNKPAWTALVGNDIREGGTSGEKGAVLTLNENVSGLEEHGLAQTMK